MSEVELQSRLAKIEEKLAHPEKSGWDIFQALASLLIPAAIAYVGYQVSQAQTVIQTHSAEQIAEKEQAIAHINAQVGQAQVVAAFLKSLLSDNLQEKQLAIAAVIIALPAEGPQLVRIISISDTNPALKKFAQASLEQRQTDLIASLYSGDQQASQGAADDLAKGWHADTNLTARLLEAAQKEETNTNGVKNTLRVLQQVDTAQLRRHQRAVEQFVRNAGTNGASIRMQAERLKAKL